MATTETIHGVDWEIGWQELRPEPERPQPREIDPLLVAAAAIVLGILVAKVIDWRAHAHPRG
jgi:hypothetical protein